MNTPIQTSRLFDPSGQNGSRMRFVVLIAVVLVVMAVLVALVFWFRPHRDIQSQTAVAHLDADSLYHFYLSREAEADSQWGNRAIVVRGTVSEQLVNQAGKTVLLLHAGDELFGVSCTLRDSLTSGLAGREVALKGFCMGLSSDVVLRDCVLITPSETSHE